MAAEIFEVPPQVAAKSHLSNDRYLSLYQRSVSDPESFWAEQARERLEWIAPWNKVLEWNYQKGEIRWFLGGKINVCHNCVDRHLKNRADKVALLWESDEPGVTKKLTYRELHAEVCRFANVLKGLGVGKGDRVAIYLPMVLELPIAMLACARIGAIHSVIFAGFSADSIRDRVLDSTCKVVLTANEGIRGGKVIPLKKIVDEALAQVSCVKNVVVLSRTKSPVPMKEGRDLAWEPLVRNASPEAPVESLDSEDPLFILYTSGSTGKPKGLVHTQAGYLLYTSITHQYVFDYHEDDIYFCAADIGWITGHSYIVYGPLANGATSVMFESTPLYPDAARYWDMIDRYKVNIFYTAPTAIRSVAKEGDRLVDRYNLTSLRVLGSVGEPINRDAWLWYYNRVGRGRCTIVDTWWQTETGGILITPLPGATRTKPGSATRPFFGVQPCVLDEQGHELGQNDVKGLLCLKFPWPGQARTVYGDHDRFVKTYFSQFPGKYFTGDGCTRDGDGYYWLTGRVDDVLLVSGHRIGTAEVESAIVTSGIVAEAAVVGMQHPIKGVGVYAFCILKDGIVANDESQKLAKQAVRSALSAIAIPDIVQFVPGLPKTRSGKIMRRILRKIVEGETDSFGDTTTLADPSVVQAIASGAQPHLKAFYAAFNR